MENPLTDESLPRAEVDTHRRISLVWLIPIVAVVAAAWLGYQAYSQQGPLVTIRFQTAIGLEAGKTRVRFKDVDVGVVETIELRRDLAGVTVQARMSKTISEFLNDRTRFWVVRPRLSGGQVSGLETLVGGTYIAVDLSSGVGDKRAFVGLDAPPAIVANQHGRSLTLLADDLGSLSEGSPVLYRGVAVGRVLHYALREPDGVAVTVFIDAPYHAEIGSNTKFWNASRFDVALDATGIRFETSSLTSVLLGAVAFGALDGADIGEAVTVGAEFKLHASRKAALAHRAARRERWRLAFDGSVRGLSIGAPVEFRGIPIGEVVDVELRIDPANRSARIPVTIAIEPSRLGFAERPDLEEGRVAIEPWLQLVRNGLRAQLKTANLVTGALFVDFDFHPNSEPHNAIEWHSGVPELPTVPQTIDELRGLVSRLARLPLDEMGDNLTRSLAGLSETMNATHSLIGRLDRETLSELNATLKQMRGTLVELEQMLEPNAPLQLEAQRALRELGAAARSLRIMADFLERHPEALIRGKGGISQ